MSDKILALEHIRRVAAGDEPPGQFAVIETAAGRFIYSLNEQETSHHGVKFEIIPVIESGFEGVTHSASLSYPASDMGFVRIKTITIPVDSPGTIKLRLGIVPYQLNVAETVTLKDIPMNGYLTTRFTFAEAVMVNITI